MSYTVKNGVLPNTPGKMDFVNVVFCLFVCLLFFVFVFMEEKEIGNMVKMGCEHSNCNCLSKICLDSSIIVCLYTEVCTLFQL